jgi:1-acyl-sn-glycerol-3-phosphate acyltransferase
VQPFKNSLFDAAVQIGADIVPICLCYHRVNNEQVTPENRELIFYYGGISFLKHLVRFLSLRSIDVEVILLKEITAHPGHSRKNLANETHNLISTEYQGLTSKE